MQGQVTLPAMPVPPQYAGIFNFLASSRLHYFRTVLRLSTRKQKVLRIVVVDAEGELFLYSDDGELKRQLAIPSHIDHVFADSQVIVLRVADDQDVVLDFHSSRSNQPEATVRRFLTVIAAFLRSDAVLEKVPRAMDHTKIGGGAVGDGTLGSLLSKSASNLLKSTKSALGMERGGPGSPSGASARSDPAAMPADDDSDAADGAGAPAALSPKVAPLSPLLSPATKISRSTGPGTFKGRRQERARRLNMGQMDVDDEWQDASIGDSSMSPLHSPGQPPKGRSQDRDFGGASPMMLPPPTRPPQPAEPVSPNATFTTDPNADGGADDDDWTFEEPTKLATAASYQHHDLPPPMARKVDTARLAGSASWPGDASTQPGGVSREGVGAFAESSSAGAGEVQDGADASTFAATVDHLRKASGLADDVEMTEAEIDALQPHEAVGILLQELRNERVGSYLEGVVTDMHCREKELENAVVEHKRRVAERKNEAARRQERLAEQTRTAAARQKSMEALSMLVLAACRRSQLLQQHVEEERESAEAHRDAWALAGALSQRDPFQSTGHSSLTAQPSLLERVAVPPCVRRHQDHERAADQQGWGSMTGAPIQSCDPNESYRAPRRYTDVFAQLFTAAPAPHARAQLRDAESFYDYDHHHHHSHIHTKAAAESSPSHAPDAWAGNRGEENRPSPLREGPNRWMTSTKYGEKLSRAYDPSVLEYL